MTLKHKLQHHLFNADVAPDFNNISIILTSLQTMANTFNDLEFNDNNRRCVKLTPDQYKIMYKARYTTPLLQSLGDLAKWFQNPHPVADLGGWLRGL